MIKKLLITSVLFVFLTGCGSLLNITTSEQRYIPEPPEKSKQQKELESQAAKHMKDYLQYAYDYGLPPKAESTKAEIGLAESLLTSVGMPSNPIPFDPVTTRLTAEYKSLSKRLSEDNWYSTNELKDYFNNQIATVKVDKKDITDKGIKPEAEAEFIQDPATPNERLRATARKLKAEVKQYRNSYDEFETQLSVVRQDEATKQTGTEISSGWLYWASASLPLWIIGIIAFIILVPGGSSIIIWIINRSRRQIGELVQGIEDYKNDDEDGWPVLKKHLQNRTSSDTKTQIEKRKNGS